MTQHNAFVSEGNDLILRSETEVEVVREMEDRTAYVTSRLIAAWITRCLVRPDTSDIKKQGAAAKRIVENHDVQSIALALNGIEQLPPFCMGTMWDLFDLERVFAKAMQMGVAPAQEVKTARNKQRIMDALKENDAEPRQIRGGIHPMV